MFWQIKQFFKKFPDVDSWAYRFYGWLYDIGLKKHKAGQKASGLTFPTELNHIHFTARATIIEPGFDAVEVVIKRMNIHREEASRVLIEFYHHVDVVLKYMKERKSDENEKEKSSVSAYCIPTDHDIRVDIPRISSKYEYDKFAESKSSNRDVNSSSDTSRVTIRTDGVIEYRLPIDYRYDLFSTVEIYHLIDHVRTEVPYDEYLAAPYIAVKRSDGILLGQIDPHKAIWTPAGPFDGGDT